MAPLTCEIDSVNEYGETVMVSIPAERALTVYVDKRELVTLMTLGAHPELLVLGFLLNQRLWARQRSKPVTASPTSKRKLPSGSSRQAAAKAACLGR
jgi:formate dehydrogenase assembly factor FdhD